MKSGVKFQPDDKDKRYLFHAHYGATQNFPDDFLWGAKDNPNQNEDGAETECTGYTQADNEADVLGFPCTPDFTYAAGLEAEGVPPNTGGCDLRSSLQGVINRGVLAKSLAPFNAKDKGELFVADIQNWTAVAPQALPDAESSYRWVTTGPFDVFDNICSASWLVKKGLSAATPFFPEWVGSILAPVPNWNGQFSLHNWSIKGRATKYVDGPNAGQLLRNGEGFLVTKTWQGFYQYFDRETINKLFTLSNTGCGVVSKDGNRMWNIICWLAQRFPSLILYLPQLWKIVNA